MRIPIDANGATEGPFSELLHLQTDFYARLTEETLKYLRRLQGAAAPAVPGTVLMPGTTLELLGTGVPGSSIELSLEVENRQRVHCLITPMLSPMVDLSGVTWFPAAEVSPPTLLLAPEQVATLMIRLPLPSALRPGTYRGALLLQGFRQGTIAVTVTVAAPAPAGEQTTASKPPVSASPAAGSTSKSSATSHRGRKRAAKKRATPKKTRPTRRRES